MSKFQRFRSLIRGIFVLVCAFLLICFPEKGYVFAALYICLYLTYLGIKSIFRYFTMSRHMVGGQSTLFVGIIVLDLGMFLFSQADDRSTFILLYLLGFHGFNGAVAIMHAMEAKRFGSPTWWRTMSFGVINLLLIVLCLVFVKNIIVLTYIYCVGLIYSGITLISAGVRKTEIVYIQ